MSVMLVITACSGKKVLSMGFTELAEWFYSNGNLLMCFCKFLSFVFCMETFAYIVSIIANITKATK